MKIFGLILFAVAHGYFAAWLAVWMLFYPREPRYLWGFKIPFTPGLLPSSRGNFENAISETIASHLLKPEILEASAIKQGLPKLIRSSIPEQIETLASDAEIQEALAQGISQAVMEYLRGKNAVKDEIDKHAMIPFGKAFGFTLDSVFSSFWKHIEEAVAKVCRSEKFTKAVRGSIMHLADELRADGTPMSQKVESLAGKMLGRGVEALDLKTVVKERLTSLSNEELEKLVHMTAGRHLTSIKRVAAAIGIMFGLLSALLFN